MNGPRVLVLPAAGTGSRLGPLLGSGLPKVLHPVAGRPMLAHLAALHRPWVDRWHVVVRPVDRPAVEAACLNLGLPAVLHDQPVPLGMLDAVLRPLEAVRREVPASVWITWCDQIGVRAETLSRLAAVDTGPGATVTLPSCRKAEPYIHFDRDDAGRIHYVRHRREGEAMPAVGEGDAGLFALSPSAYLEELPRYAAAPDAAGHVTGERNFLPFLPWIEAIGRVSTFPCLDDEESIGVNTPADLAAMEAYLARR
jgi:bifunctional UDP-N-acetylglucosamine pyrophosphorylase / glucosamine-1-phosphate N-acetyltransferase